MLAANITVNLPNHEKSYKGAQGETPDQIIQRVTALHPDWTSMVLVIGRDMALYQDPFFPGKSM